MIGAILGDIVGEPYEYDRSPKIKDFGPLFAEADSFTDDSVMTIAVADALLHTKRNSSEKKFKKELIKRMKKWGRKYPDADYGNRFHCWLMSSNKEPYNSFGNGSAMRVSSVGWLYPTLERTREVARYTAEVTHNHPEGIKGAEAVAAAIYMARTGSDKSEILLYIEKEFGYDLRKTCNEIRPSYKFDVTCQGTVPQAIRAFYEGKDFEDCIRTAVSLGGDCDTLTCITGGMAEAYYEIPELLECETYEKITPDMRKVCDKFWKRTRRR